MVGQVILPNKTIQSGKTSVFLSFFLAQFTRIVIINKNNFLR